MTLLGPEKGHFSSLSYQSLAVNRLEDQKITIFGTFLTSILVTFWTPFGSKHRDFTLKPGNWVQKRVSKTVIFRPLFEVHKSPFLGIKSKSCTNHGGLAELTEKCYFLDDHFEIFGPGIHFSENQVRIVHESWRSRNRWSRTTFSEMTT